MALGPVPAGPDAPAAADAGRGNPTARETRESQDETYRLRRSDLRLLRHVDRLGGRDFHGVEALARPRGRFHSGLTRMRLTGSPSRSKASSAGRPLRSVYSASVSTSLPTQAPKSDKCPAQRAAASGTMRARRRCGFTSSAKRFWPRMSRGYCLTKPGGDGLHNATPTFRTRLIRPPAPGKAGLGRWAKAPLNAPFFKSNAQFFQSVADRNK